MLKLVKKNEGKKLSDRCYQFKRIKKAPVVLRRLKENHHAEKNMT